MKKLLIYSSIIWAALAVSSCYREPLPGPQGTGEGTCIDLRVRSSEPITKAFPDGEDAYNENTVYTLDYFIFDVDPTVEANANTSAVTYGRISYAAGVKPVDETSSKAAGEIIDLKEYFSASKKNGYVYVIANLPDKTSSPNNYFEVNSDGNLQQVVVGTQTTTVLAPNYATLQAVEVIASFDKLTNNKFTAQTSFVMAGLQGFELSGSGADPVEVKLSRIASKISLDMNVIKYIPQYITDASAQQHYQNSWFPNVDMIQVYLNYVNPKGLVSGSYENRKYEIGSYFSYNRYAFDSEVDGDGEYKEKVLDFDIEGNVIYENGKPKFVDGNIYPAFNVTGTPFYSYPTTWDASDATAPFIKIIIPWVAYEITSEDYQNPTDATARAALIAAAADFPTELTVNGNVVGTRDLEMTTPSDMVNRGGHEFYYKINIPAAISEGSSVNALQANYWYKLNLDIAVLGSDAEDLPVELAGDYYIVDWSAPAEKMGGDLNAGRYLQIAANSFDMYGDEIEIPVKSSHNLTITGISAKYPIFTGNSTSGDLEDTDFSVSAPDRTKVVLSHEINAFPGTTQTPLRAQDVAPITYEFTVQHTDNANYSAKITVTQYPAIYISQFKGMNVFIDGFFQFLDAAPTEYVNYITVGNGATRGYRSARFSTGQDSYLYYPNPTATNENNPSWNSQIVTPYGNLYYNRNNIVESESKLTLITVTSFSQNSASYTMGNVTYNYIITDPRVKPSWRDRSFRFNNGTRYESVHLVPYLVSHQSNNGNFTAWTDAQEAAILVGGGNTRISDTEYAAPIAPAFLISSRWGRPGSGDFPVTIQEAQQRCATYQEAGFPAGRWRLPTEAEINFVYTLQTKGFVGDIFTTDGYGYWASSGRYFGGDYGASFGTPSENGRNTSIRCVYDYWYWGDAKAEDVYKYTPKP